MSRHATSYNFHQYTTRELLAIRKGIAIASSGNEKDTLHEIDQVLRRRDNRRLDLRQEHIDPPVTVEDFMMPRK